MTTLSEALAAYRICARAEGRSPRTIEWITSSMRYFADFLGEDKDIAAVTANDLRRFIITLQKCRKYRDHPYNIPQPEKLSPRSIETYCRGIRAFFGFLAREELINSSPMAKIKPPKVPRKVTPTFSQQEVERLLPQPDKKNRRGFWDYAVMLVLVDTGARVSEIANLKLPDVDLDNGQLKVMGKGGKERYLPFGHKVAKILLKYKLKYRPEPVGTEGFFRIMTEGRFLQVGSRKSATATGGWQGSTGVTRTS